MIQWAKENFSRCELAFLAMMALCLAMGIATLITILIIYVEPELPYSRFKESSTLCNPSFMCDR